MSTADSPPTRAARWSRGLLLGFLQSGRGRGAALLVLFALVLATAARAAPDRPDLLASTRAHTGSDAPQTRLWRMEATEGALRFATRDAAPESVALEPLLARYDALIRAVEARSVAAERPQTDSALAELRILRERTYATARRALLASGTE